MHTQREMEALFLKCCLSSNVGEKERRQIEPEGRHIKDKKGREEWTVRQWWEMFDACCVRLTSSSRSRVTGADASSEGESGILSNSFCPPFGWSTRWARAEKSAASRRDRRPVVSVVWMTGRHHFIFGPGEKRRRSLFDALFSHIYLCNNSRVPAAVCLVLLILWSVGRTHPQHPFIEFNNLICRIYPLVQSTGMMRSVANLSLITQTTGIPLSRPNARTNTWGKALRSIRTRDSWKEEKMDRVFR